MGEGGSEVRAPVRAGSWTLHLEGSAPCDGTDSHSLAISGRVRLGLVIGGSALFALVIAVGQISRFGAVAGGLCLGAILSAGYSARVRGGTLVFWRYGTTRVVQLGDVVEVQLYRYRNATSLRFFDRSGKRVGWVSARILARRPDAAAHLRHWLDRPDVAWGPGTWALVAPDGGLGIHSPAPVEAHQPAGASGLKVPRGRRVGGRPRSKWSRFALWFSAACVLFGTVVLTVMVPVTWSDYALSQRIQHGTKVIGELRSEWVTSTTDRSGTHHTTHFDVTFTDSTQAQVTAQIEAHGLYGQWPAGHPILVVYNPSDPAQAELPGHPNHTFVSALVVSAVTVVLWLMSVVYARSWRRVRRIKRQAGLSHRAHEQSSPTVHVDPSELHGSADVERAEYFAREAQGHLYADGA